MAAAAGERPGTGAPWPAAAAAARAPSNEAAAWLAAAAPAAYAAATSDGAGMGVTIGAAGAARWAGACCRASAEKAEAATTRTVQLNNTAGRKCERVIRSLFPFACAE